MPKTKLIDFSPKGEKLAHSGPDGVLRIWDTTSGILEHEYQPAEHLKATTSCIKYAPKKTGDTTSSSLLAMGTLAGTILLYSPEESGVKSTLEHSSHQAVVDVAWFSSTRLVSLARDNTIVDWDIDSGKKHVLDTVCEGSAICLFGKKRIVVGNRRIQLLFVNDSGKVKVKNTFTGHMSPVTQLLKIKTEKNSENSYFLSSSIDDRFIYAWSTGSQGEDPISSFMVKDMVAHTAVGELNNSSLSLAAVTQKGSLVLFTHHLNGSGGKCKVIKRTGSLQICNQSDGKKTTIPIVAAYFCNDSPANIIIVYQKLSLFAFERMPLDKIVGDQELIRAEPSPSKGVNTFKTLTPSTDEATMVGALQTPTSKTPKGKRKRNQSDNVASLPMEERLNVLNLETTGKGMKPSTDSAQLLLQGLHSNDKAILGAVFECSDQKTIDKTVRRLPLQAIVPLMEHLAKPIMGKGLKNANHVKWVRSVLYNHMSHLSTVPNREELMEPFFNICTARISTYTQVTQLHARLDLMLTHIATRHQEVDPMSSNQEALLVYKDESSDEEDMVDPLIRVSESEDNWDELSDVEEEMNGPSEDDDDSDMEVEEAGLTAVKRKLEIAEDLNGDISSSEEENEDDSNDEEEDEGDEEDDSGE